MKVKLLQVESYYDYDDRDLAKGISDWEEVSDEDYRFIRDNMWHLRSDTNMVFALVCQDTAPIQERITGIKETVLKAKRAQEERDAEFKKKQEEQKQKRLETKLRKDKESLKKFLEKNPDLLSELSTGV